MNWTLIQTIFNIPLVRSGEWRQAVPEWLDFPEKRSVFRLDFNCSDVTEIKARFLARQYFPSPINAVTAPLFIYPTKSILITPVLSLPYEYAWEFCRYYSTRINFVEEPSYSISVYASRIDL